MIETYLHLIDGGYRRLLRMVGRVGAAMALAGGVLLSPHPAVSAALAQAQPQNAASWLDQSQLARWNVPGAGVPGALAPAGADPGNPNCASAERSPEIPEDRQVTGAGWRLYREAQSAGPVRVVWGLSGYDGMCRPLGYQAFAFANGAFAGTFAPSPMDSRADGSLQGLTFVAPSASAGALATLSGVFNRYEPNDPACCPSRLTTVGFQVLVPDPGQASILVATRAVTSLSAPLRPGPAPTPSVPTTPADPAAPHVPGTYTASFQGISFTFSLALAPWVQWQVAPAVPVQQAPGLGGATPQHILFSFAESNSDPAAQLLDIRHPQLRVLPVEGLRALDPSIAETVDSLQALLASRPAVPTAPIPVFPPLPSHQQLQARVQYLDFPGGSGVAFVTRYAQDVSPVTNQSVAFTFQGLTADGQTYVTLFWPVDSTALPDSYDAGLAGQTYDAFAAQFEAYLASTTQTLNAQPTSAFTPDLALLVGLVQSLRIGS